MTVEFFPGDSKPLLTAEQIKDRLDRFNDTNDWTVFGDVPESQQVNVMYPHTFKKPYACNEDVKKAFRKMALNAEFGPIGRYFPEWDIKFGNPK